MKWMTFSIFLANLSLCLMKSHLTLLLAHICPDYNAFKRGWKYLYLKTPKNHANFPMRTFPCCCRAWAMEKARGSSVMFGGQTANALCIFAFWSHILKKMFTKCYCELFHFHFPGTPSNIPILNFCWLEYCEAGYQPSWNLWSWVYRDLSWYQRSYLIWPHLRQYQPLTSTLLIS